MKARGALLVAALAGTAALPSCSLLTPTGSPAVVQVTVSAADPGSPVNEGLVGTNSPGPAADQAVMQAIGLDWIRVGVNLASGYDCATGAWDPSSLDSQVAAAEALGGTPEIDVGGTPSCLVTGAQPGQSTTNDPPDIGAANQTAWDGLVYQMAYHEITAEGVTVFEVEDEPDWVYWNGTMAQYFQTYNDTATSLEKAASAAGKSILVGGPTLANVLDTMDTAWLDPFLAYVSSHDLPLDFLSWHIYPDDPLAGPSPGIGALCFGNPPGPDGNPCYYNPGLNVSLFATETEQAKDALAAYPDLHPLLVIDEWNLDGEYDARQNGPFDAAFAAAALTEAQSAGVDRMCLWDTADNSNDPLGNWGMLNADLSPKPVYYSFLFWHDLSGDTVPLSFYPEISLGSPFGSVGGIGSVSETGSVNVMVYNFQPYDLTNEYGTTDPTPTDHYVVLDVTGLKPGVTYAWTRQAVDATHSGTMAATGTVSGSSGDAQVSFTLPGDSVSLVTFTPAP